MATDSTQFLTTLIDNASGEVRSVESINKKGDWYFVQLSNYTLASPLSIANGVTSKIPFTQSDISYTNGNGNFVTRYDFINQKFMPTTVGDLYSVEVRFKYKATNNDGHFDIKVESPTFGFNPINGTTISSVKAANVEQFCSVNFKVFVGQDLVDNGIEFKVVPQSTGIQIYDVSYLVVRLCSGK